MSLDLPTLLELARHVVDQAARRLRTARPTTILPKGDRDVLTDLDLRTEHDIRAALRAATPGFGFLGEEEGGDPAGTHWVLDPIDGTVNFIRGLPLCGISLALIEHGTPVLGVIALPFLNRCYWAASGAGAWRDGHPIHASTAGSLPGTVLAVGDYGTGSGAADRNRIALALHARLAPTVQRIRMLGSAAVDLALVADGTLDASITLGNRPWDMAAGTVIAREAGAAVVDLDGSPHTTASRATIATAAPLRPALLQIVNAAQTATPSL